MTVLDLLVPRPQSPAVRLERVEEEEFHALVRSIETLLFTSVDAGAREAVVLATAMAELEARLPAPCARP